MEEGTGSMAKLTGKERVLFGLCLLACLALAGGAIQSQGWWTAVFLAGCLASILGAIQVAALPHRRKSQKAWEDLNITLDRLAKMLAVPGTGGGRIQAGMTEPLERLGPVLESLRDQVEQAAAREEARWERLQTRQERGMVVLSQIARSVATSQEENIRAAAERHEAWMREWERLAAPTHGAGIQPLLDALEKGRATWREEIQGLFSEFSRVVEELGSRVETGLESGRSAASVSFDPVRRIEEKDVSENARRLEEFVEAQARAMAEIRASLEAHSHLGRETAQQAGAVVQGLDQASQRLFALIEGMEANQAQWQSAVAMLQSGLASMLERLEDRGDEVESGRNLLEELREMLAVFHEKSAEILLENSLKTREILLQALAQPEPRP